MIGTNNSEERAIIHRVCHDLRVSGTYIWSRQNKDDLFPRDTHQPHKRWIPAAHNPCTCRMSFATCCITITGNTCVNKFATQNVSMCSMSYFEAICRNTPGFPNSAAWKDIKMPTLVQYNKGRTDWIQGAMSMQAAKLHVVNVGLEFLTDWSRIFLMVWFFFEGERLD